MTRIYESRFENLLALHINFPLKAIWALGNISGDSADLRDIALRHGALQPMLKIIDESYDNEKILKLATWATSNISRGRPLPKGEYVIAAIPTLLNVLQSQTDSEALRDAAWALSAISHCGGHSGIDLILTCPNALPAVVSLLS